MLGNEQADTLVNQGRLANPPDPVTATPCQTLHTNDNGSPACPHVTTWPGLGPPCNDEHSCTIPYHNLTLCADDWVAAMRYCSLQGPPHPKYDLKCEDYRSSTNPFLFLPPFRLYWLPTCFPIGCDRVLVFEHCNK